MKRLSGLDATFLYLETPSMHMHVASLGIFDPSTAAEAPTFERIVELTEERLHLVPSFRQRLATVPFELHHPVWVDDPDFDIRYHIRRAALPSPGDDRELAAMAADITSRPLDRNRPLWEMHVIEGLADGNIAVVTKTHHAAIDGVSGMDLTLVLLDLTPEPAPVEPPAEPFRPEPVPSDLSMLAYAVSSLSRQPVRVLRALPKTARGLLNARRVQRTPNLAPPPTPFRLPRTSLNVAVTPHRAFAHTKVPLDDLKAVKNTFGGTLNDVVLAVTSGALVRYFDARGEQYDESLAAMVPISVRTDEQSGAMGNQVSSMLVSLATNQRDPVERLHAISASTAGAKETHSAIGANLLGDWSEFFAPALAARAARLYSRMNIADRISPPYNLTISNVPGPPFPLYSFGSKMVGMYPMGPINEGAALNVTVTSYLGEMEFGLHACREAVPDVWSLADAVEDAAAELISLAGGGARTKGRSRSKPATAKKATPRKKAAPGKKATSARRPTKKAASRAASA